MSSHKLKLNGVIPMCDHKYKNNINHKDDINPDIFIPQIQKKEKMKTQRVSNPCNKSKY